MAILNYEVPQTFSDALLSPLIPYYLGVILNSNILLMLKAIFFIYLSFLAGDRLLKILRIEQDSSNKKIAHGVMLGYGLYAMLGTMLGIIGRFNGFYLWLWSLIVILLSSKTIFWHIRQIKTYRLSKITLKDFSFLKLIVVLWVVVNIFILFVPITGNDAIDYHLPIIFDLLKNQRLTFDESIEKFSHLPVAAEILYAAPMTMFREKTAPFVFQILQYSVLALFLMLAYEFLNKRVENKFLVWSALLAMLSITDFLREIMHGGYIDVFVYLFGLAGILLALDYISENKTDVGGLVLSAIFLGIALSMKYIALVFLFFIGFFLAAHFWKQKMRLTKALKLFLVYFAIILLVAGFWYAKNLINFGNPVYPMFSSSEDSFKGALKAALFKNTITNFLIFPLMLFGLRFVSDKETASRLIVFGYYISFYATSFLALVFVELRKKLGVTELFLFIFIQGYASIMFFMSHQIRFMLPSAIMTTVFLALVIDKIYICLKSGIGESFYKNLIKISTASAGIIFLIFFIGNFHYFYVKYLNLLGHYGTESEYIEAIGGQ